MNSLRDNIKFLIVLMVGLVTAACTDSVKQVDTKNLFPPELADCKVYDIWLEGGYMKVFRCPNSSTSVSYRQGKTTAWVVTIDG